MTSKLTRDVVRRPTLVTYGSDQQPRLLPLIESSAEESHDASDVKPQSNDDVDVKSPEDNESLADSPDDDESLADLPEDSESVADSDDYDTDLDGEGQ